MDNSSEENKKAAKEIAEKIIDLTKKPSYEVLKPADAKVQHGQ